MNDFLDNFKQKARVLKKETYALYLACRDARTPWYAKILAACVVGYAFSPIDLIPDFIPILGLLDDLILIPLGIALVIKMIPPEVMVEARKMADEATGTGKPTNWYAASVIVLIWVLIIVFSGWLAFSLFGN